MRTEERMQVPEAGVTAPSHDLPERPRRRGIFSVVAVATAGIFLLGGIGLWRTAGSSPEPPGALGSLTQPLLERPAVSADSLQRSIESLQDRLHRIPDDWQGFADLGLAYVQVARVTGDPSYYPKAEGALARSLELHPDDNVPAFTGMGSLAAARHDFGGALRWAERARAADPSVAAVYGVIGDAQIELGRYDAAFATVQHMVDLKPSLSSYARASYARELQGDVAGAVQIMRLALQAAGSSEDAAFAAYQLGELYLNSGDLDRARRSYRQGAQLAPGYVPPAAGLAKVAWAGGDVDRAISLYGEVVERYPAPEYVAALGDLYAIEGRADMADQQYSVVRAEERLFRANGVDTDLELALFEADHGNPSAALDAARSEWGRRHSVHVADALAWALYASGRYGEALRYADRAAVLGYRNALFSFHRGMIELRLGDRAAARRDLRAAVETNPHFSILHARTAARTLATLESDGAAR